MHHSSSGLSPSGTARVLSRASILSKVPSFVHSSKKFQTVFQGPYSVGMSRHGAPVRNTQNIAPARIPGVQRMSRGSDRDPEGELLYANVRHRLFPTAERPRAVTVGARNLFRLGFGLAEAM